MKSIISVANWMWDNVIGYILLAVGLYYSLRLGFPQFKYAGNIKRVLKKNLKSGDNISGFAALATAVGGQVGTGSLVGSLGWTWGYFLDVDYCFIRNGNYLC